MSDDEIKKLRKKHCRELGKFLKDKRERAGLSQKVVADELGYPVKTATFGN